LIPGRRFEIIARITGTLLQPKLALESDQHPPLSETELVSYLMFGRSSFAVNSGGAASQNQSAALATGISYFSSALSSEIQRTLISDLGVPIDYLDIRPGTVSSGTGFRDQQRRLAGGTGYRRLAGGPEVVSRTAHRCLHQRDEFLSQRGVPAQPAASLQAGGRTDHALYHQHFRSLPESKALSGRSGHAVVPGLLT
jgi:hypothetical protein